MYVILVAMEKEAQYIQCPNAKVIVTGIGCNNVISTLCKAFIKKKVSYSDTFINVGYAGSSCFNIGDVVAVRSVKRLRPCYTIDEEAYPLTFETFEECLYAPCYTADEFYEGKKAIPLVDMELFFIKSLCSNLISYKIVSDNCSSNEYKAFNSEKAWNKVNKILNKIVNEEKESFKGQQGF
jgi:hypothetical protein